MADPKTLRLNTAERVLLDICRQYLRTSSESAAASLAIRLLAEQLLAQYLATGVHRDRQPLILAGLNALRTPLLPGLGEPPPATRWYRVDDGTQRLLAWCPGAGTHQPVPVIPLLLIRD